MARLYKDATALPGCSTAVPASPARPPRPPAAPGGGPGLGRPLRPRGAAGALHRPLTARDEHRQHYPLTSVAPPFTEIALPGVHANIGGGYNQLEEGPKLLSRPRRQQLRRPAVADYQIPPLAMLQATTAYAETQADAERWRQQLGVGDKEIWVDVWHQWQQQRRAGSRSVLLSPVL
ncbi:hypothetical protein G6F46_013750 [Rhizopus delemar]|nr:hypothetical protein G6F46_013750 [Rhizopus delemar]